MLVENLPFLEKVRQAVGSAPKYDLHGNAQGVVNIAFEFMEFGTHLWLHHILCTLTWHMLAYISSATSSSSTFLWLEFR